MTAALDPETTRPGPTGDGGAGAPRGFFKSRYGSTSLRVGVATTWLSVIVLLPLAAIVWQSAGGGWDAFWTAVTSNAAMQSFRVTLTISFAVAVINLFFGLLVAWVLTRDEFGGKRLVDAIIDLPFALPTIVASLVMLALYGPSSPVGIHIQHTKWGIGVALLFVTLPFVVRSVQPVRCCRRCFPVRAWPFRAPSVSTARWC
jgi:sulfate transport system permease protein